MSEYTTLAESLAELKQEMKELKETLTADRLARVEEASNTRAVLDALHEQADDVKRLKKQVFESGMIQDLAYLKRAGRWLAGIAGTLITVGLIALLSSLIKVGG